MLSRVAESIYWMNRYIERADNVARFVDVNFHLHLDLPSINGQQWEALIHTTGDYEAFANRLGKPTRATAVQFLAFDPLNPNSILSCMSAARENARTVREIIPSEIWEHVNTYYIMVCEAAKVSAICDSPHDFLEQVKSEGHQFTGITHNCMPHGEVWHFARLGRFIERADKTLRIMDVKTFLESPDRVEVGSSVDAIQWAALLRSVSATAENKTIERTTLPQAESSPTRAIA